MPPVPPGSYVYGILDPWTDSPSHVEKKMPRDAACLTSKGNLLQGLAHWKGTAAAHCKFSSLEQEHWQ